MKRYLDRKYAVLGLGIFGSTVAKTLSRYGCDVIAIDKDITCVDRIVEEVNEAVKCDVTDISQLSAAKLEDCDVAIVGMGSHLEETVMAIINLKELGIPYIIAKAKNKRYKEIFQKIGADKVVRPEKEMGVQIAKSVLGKNITDLINLDQEYSIVEFNVPSKWANRSLIELDVRKKYNMNIIAIRNDSKLIITPDPAYRLKEDDQLMVICDQKTLEEFDHLTDK